MSTVFCLYYNDDEDHVNIFLVGLYNSMDLLMKQVESDNITRYVTETCEINTTELVNRVYHVKVEDKWYSQ